jgi:hypothetical protein
VIGVNATSLDLFQQVYRNPSLPLMTRMRAAGMALPHEHPKLAVTAVVSEGDFANQLDRTVLRGSGPSVSSSQGRSVCLADKLDAAVATG